MEHNDWNSEYPNQPWNPETYRTGATRPPKRRGGLIAFLLVLVIFLGGIASLLSVLNVRLFRAISQEPKPEDHAIMFASDETQATAATEETQPADTLPQPTEQIAATSPQGDMELSLNQSPTSVPNVIQEGGLSLQEIYKKAIDSVVSITCDSGSGTGVVLSEDGYIVTNNHVIENARHIQVQFTDGQVLDASVIGVDAVSDLAVLYVQATGLIPAEFGDSTALQVGDSVVAIGDPLGVELRGTMTNGIVSAINREVAIGGRTMTLIQTNAALNSGNSGGPLLNCYGQVIGINTMKIGDYMSSAGVEGLGFAIPSITVKDIVDQLVSQGHVSGRPTLGITGEAVSDFYQLYYRLPQGLYITEVLPGCDAEVKGVQPGDILLQVNDTRILDMEDLTRLLYGLEVGDEVQILLYRGGRQFIATLIAEEATS